MHGAFGRIATAGSSVATRLSSKVNVVEWVISSRPQRHIACVEEGGVKVSETAHHMERTMQMNNWLFRCKTIGKEGASVLGWAVLGAAVGATAAGLFGLLFGALDGLIRDEFGRTIGAAGYFALCGVVAGALLGALARLIDPEGVTDLIRRLPE